MTTWRSLSSMASFPVQSPAWEAMREDVFVNGKEVHDKEGNSLFMFAVWSGHINVALALHDMGCDPSTVNKKGFMVVQSLIRDVSTYSKNRSPEYVASVIDQIPFTWSLRDSNDEAASISHASGWCERLLGMNVSDIPSKSLTSILSFIAQPLDYHQLSGLSHLVRASSNAGPDSVINSLAWKAQLAKKGSKALINVVPKKIRDKIDQQNKNPAQPKI